MTMCWSRITQPLYSGSTLRHTSHHPALPKFGLVDLQLGLCVGTCYSLNTRLTFGLSEGELVCGGPDQYDPLGVGRTTLWVRPWRGSREVPRAGGGRESNNASLLSSYN